VLHPILSVAADKCAPQCSHQKALPARYLNIYLDTICYVLLLNFHAGVNATQGLYSPGAIPPNI
jgi:hypothetical protein